jgi:hypothetical protein
MGIKRLNQFLKDVFKREKLKTLQGKTVGVDAMGWICQLVYSFDPESTEIKLTILRKMELKV